MTIIIFTVLFLKDKQLKLEMDKIRMMKLNAHSSVISHHQMFMKISIIIVMIHS